MFLKILIVDLQGVEVWTHALRESLLLHVELRFHILQVEVVHQTELRLALVGEVIQKVSQLLHLGRLFWKHEVVGRVWVLVDGLNMLGVQQVFAYIACSQKFLFLCS